MISVDVLVRNLVIVFSFLHQTMTDHAPKSHRGGGIIYSPLLCCALWCDGSDVVTSVLWGCTLHRQIKRRNILWKPPSPPFSLSGVHCVCSPSLPFASDFNFNLLFR